MRCGKPISCVSCNDSVHHFPNGNRDGLESGVKFLNVSTTAHILSESAFPQVIVVAWNNFRVKIAHSGTTFAYFVYSWES